MNTSALITMLLAQVTVTCFAIYFFVKVYRAPNKDSDDFPPGP